MAEKELFRLLPFLCFWVVVGAQEICYPSDLKAVMVRLKRFSTNTEDNFTAIHVQIAGMLKKQTGFDSEIMSLKQENEALKRSSSNSENNLTDINGQIEGMLQKQIWFDIELMSLKLASEALKRSISNTEKNLTDINVQTEGMLQKQTSFDSETMALKQDFAALKRITSNLESNLTYIYGQIAEMLQKQAGFDSEIMSLMQENAALKRSTSNTENNLTDINRQIEWMLQNQTGFDSEIKSLQQENTVIKLETRDLKQQIVGLNNKISNLEKQINVSEANIQMMDLALTSLRTKTLEANVAFIARSPVDADPVLNTSIPFRTEELDTQGSFNHTSGVFTAPVNGTYLFSVQICTGRRNGIYYAIKSSKSSSNVHAAAFNSAYDFQWECSSVTTVIGLQQYETVWLEVVSKVNSGYSWNVGDNAWCMFMGVLL